MNLVNLEAAAKAFGPRVLLDQVSLGVADGDRVGVVGRNGAGKSTLLAALAGPALTGPARDGHTELDAGRVTHAGGLSLGYLAQADELDGRIGDLVFGAGVAEHTWAADPRAREVAGALLGGLDLDGQAGRLSGGEGRRVALAALLATPRDLLLLDEPTNHLDIEAISWLAGFLRRHAAAYVVVTHDRWFLDETCDRTWEVAGGQVHAYQGGYSAYVLARAERARIEDATEQRRRNLVRKELAWLRRGPPARTSKPQFRIDAATALIGAEPPPRDTVELTRMATARLGKTVLEILGVTVTAGPRILLDDVTWRLGPGDRVGVAGPNGSGKTTLLRLLSGRVEPGAGDGSAAAGAAGDGLAATGEVVRGSTVQIGYLTQEAPDIDPGLRALEAAQQVSRSVRVGRGELTASQLLERFGLSGERQWTLVGDLSGGERRRLQLLLALMAEPNVLLLDEPTNDLDIDTLTELEDLLDGWPGSIVVVSHDRYFLERVTDHVLALDSGRLDFLAGGVTEYLERRAAVTHRNPAINGSPAAAAVPAGPSAATRQRAAQKELARLDRQLAAVTKREAELTAELAASATDYAKLIELGDELKAAQASKAELEDRWLEVAQEADPG
ncbi:MAG TPA: ABC-F family ATP-binding cassette domain-containing protein [Streptosporangiaceae bacterium]|nr:ABC-F family ATP-binding cassette domain-containing protein [Streptosporangiaceae bacterium]